MLTCGECEYTQNVEQSKALHARPGPMIIISASGMCEAGRILHHLKNNIENPRNTILITGFQAAHTLGRRLVEKQKRVKIFGETYAVKAKVRVLNGFSAHADASELAHMVEPLANRARQAFLVHGEPDQAEALAATMRRLGFRDVQIPRPGQTFPLAVNG
jgi:metallo-beta-lactamase family protein